MQTYRSITAAARKTRPVLYVSAPSLFWRLPYKPARRATHTRKLNLGGPVRSRTNASLALIILGTAATTLFAQSPPPAPGSIDLKTFLDLSDAQIQGIAQAQQQLQRDVQPV